MTTRPYRSSGAPVPKYAEEGLSGGHYRGTGAYVGVSNAIAYDDVPFYESDNKFQLQAVNTSIT